MKIVKYLFVMAAMLLLASCSKDVNVKLSNDNLEFEAAGGSAEINVESNGAWQVSDVPEWLTISPLSGEGNSTLSVSCLANTDSQNRSAQIKVTTKDNVASFAVKQAFVEGDFITFTPDSLNCDFQGGEFSIKVEANCDWSIALLPNWIHCEPMSGSHSANITMTIQRYDFSSENNREYNVDFVAGEQHFYLPVVQENNQAYLIVPTPGSITFGSEGGTQTVVLQSITAWTLECSADWVSVTPTSGDGDGEISVTASPNTDFNTRSARIVLTSSVGCTSSIMVNQEAAINPHYLEVNPSELLFPSEENSINLAISTDSLWRVQCSASWISVSEETGTGDATITVTAQAYTLFGNRRAELDVISGSITRTIRIIQESGSSEPALSFTTDYLQLDSEYSSTPVSVLSNVAWTLRMSEDWVNSTVMEGLGDSNIEIEVKPNYGQEPRTAMVFLCYHGVVYDTLMVEQEGRVYHLETNVTELHASNQGDTFLVSVSANQSWKVTCNVGWLHFDPVNGDGDGEFRIFVDLNNTAVSRTGEIRLVGGVTGVVSIFVIQSNL